MTLCSAVPKCMVSIGYEQTSCIRNRLGLSREPRNRCRFYAGPRYTATDETNLAEQTKRTIPRKRFSLYY
jgi:hypothetical protein